MPSHDETSPVGPPAGSLRRPPPDRASRSGAGGGRPRPGGAGRPAGRDPRGAARADRGRTTTSRTGASRAGARKPAGQKNGKQTAQRERRRIYKILAAGAAAFIVLLGVFVGVVYANTSVPSLDSVAQDQTTIFYYSDGTTEMARLGTENRINVPLDQVSTPAQEAVLAAENRNFYDDPGISITGIVRAAWNNLTGGSTQGGSTITQQYVKNTLLTADQTFSRKFQELFLAVKLDNNYSKDEILEGYLNTIYFGRGAYGIQAAAQTYFGVDAAALTAQQGAVLAVLIRSPSRYDPANDAENAEERWGAVLDGMVEQGWLSEADRRDAVYPEVLPITDSSLGFPAGPEGLIVQQALGEVQASLNITQDQAISGGYRITTTVDKAYQDAAVAAVDDVMTGEDPELREALVSMDPRSGAVLAYYGGAQGTDFDYARAQRQPGSSFKPYTLATALEQGIGVNARRDGSSPQTFPDREKPVRNYDGSSCYSCTLVQAMVRSLNTTFYGLAYEVGADAVRDTALAATGLPEEWQGGQFEGDRTLANADGYTGGAIGIGEYVVRPIDQAQGFATLANGGVRHNAFFVSRVTDSLGRVVLENAGDAGTQALPADVASDTTYAMEGVAKHSRLALDGNRPVASKTGTQGQGDSNSDAWMVGFTPSISTAVWMGKKLPSEPIVNAAGRVIYGSGLPGEIWQQYMDAVLDGTPEEDLPSSAIIRGDNGNGVPAPITQAPRRTTKAPKPTTQAPAPTTEAPEPEPAPPPPPPGDGNDGGQNPGDGGEQDPGNGGGPPNVQPGQSAPGNNETAPGDGQPAPGNG